MEWVWGLLQTGFVRWAPPHASHDHFNHCFSVCPLTRAFVAVSGRYVQSVICHLPSMHYAYFCCDRLYYAHGIKHWCCLTSVCLSRTSWIFMAPTATESKARWALQACMGWSWAAPCTGVEAYSAASRTACYWTNNLSPVLWCSLLQNRNAVVPFDWMPCIIFVIVFFVLCGSLWQIFRC